MMMESGLRPPDKEHTHTPSLLLPFSPYRNIPYHTIQGTGYKISNSTIESNTDHNSKAAATTTTTRTVLLLLLSIIILWISFVHLDVVSWNESISVFVIVIVIVIVSVIINSSNNFEQTRIIVDLPVNFSAVRYVR